MTEKRFISNYDGSEIIDRKESLAYAFHSGAEEPVIELLNKLNNENEQLKSRIKDYDVALKKLQDLTDKKLKENEQLKQAIAETEKMVQSTYDELTKLRCIKNNLNRIKNQWNWIMEAIQYD